MSKKTFGDILIVPQKSYLKSRNDIDTSANLGLTRYHLSIPIISAPMDTVTELDMQIKLSALGALGIHHRYTNNDTLSTASLSGGIAVAPSMGKEFIINLVSWYRNHPFVGNPLVVLDIAHGHSLNALDYAEFCVSAGCDVISGNICTYEAALDYWRIGVKIMRVGIGGGSSCSTRIISGCGYPQFSALKDMREGLDGHQGTSEIKLISDGGHKSSGDIVKALIYADAVMLGGLLAGTDETPPMIKLKKEKPKEYQPYAFKHGVPYRGMASREALKEAGKTIRVEGVSGYVPYQGSVKHVLADLAEGIRAGFAYVGARNIREFHERARFIRITGAGIREGEPRI